MPRMNGGRAIAAALKAEGITHIFGIVGTHNSPMFDGVYNDPSFHVVTVRHEQGATMMAAGYARATGRIAAVFVVPGPGLTNAITGMGMAYSESAPMLVFGGQNAHGQLEREGGHFHELANSIPLAATVCGYTTRVATAADLPKVVREAMRAMRSKRPRPAYIEVPLDVPGEFLSFSAAMAHVQVRLEEPERTRTFANVPIVVRNAAYQTALTPARQQITVRGPQSATDALELDHGAVYIDAVGREPGSYQITPAVDLPAGIELVKQEPAAVELRVLRQKRRADGQ